MVNYKKQMGALVTGQMLSLVLNFMLPLILVRVLTKNDYGLYAQFNVILSFCTVFFSFGLSSELYFSYPSAKESEKRILVFQSLLMLVLAGILAFGILGIPIIRQYIISDNVFEGYYLYLCFCVLFSVPEILITALYVLNHDNKTSALFLPLMTAFRLILILLIYLKWPTVESIFIAILVSVVIKFVFVMNYVYKLIKKNRGAQLINKKLLIEQLSYSIPLGIASSTRVLVQQMDKLIILAFVSPAVYAIYSIAFYGVPGLTQVYLSISQVYIPRMAAAFKKNDHSNVIALYHSMVSKTLSYTIPIVLIIILFADPIIPFVFSLKYTESIPYFQLYLLTFIVSSIGCGNILRATGETKKSLSAYIYSAIILVPFTYFSIKYYYLNGAIVSAIIGSILPKILLSIYDAKTMKLSIVNLFPWKTILKISLISVLTLVPFILIYFIVGHQNFWISLVWIILYLIIVFCIQMYFKVFVISYTSLLVGINNFIKRK